MSNLTLNSQNFDQEVLQSRIPVLVDFSADWCGPCQALKPVLEELEEDKEFKGKMKIGKVNVDNENELAGKYGVMSIPTLLFFNKGEIVKTLVGLQTKETLVEEIKKIRNDDR